MPEMPAGNRPTELLLGSDGSRHLEAPEPAMAAASEYNNTKIT